MYLFKKKVLFSALMLLLGLGMISNQVLAQEKKAEKKADGKLYGKVIDHSSDQPIADIEITLKDNEKKATSGDKGMYAFKSLPVGTYTVVVSADGYQDWKQEVEVTEKGKMLKIELKPTESK